MLSNLGIPVVNKAHNGQEAVEIAMADYYDIIIMDLNMPIMDGYDACKKIKKFYEDNRIFGGGLGYYNGEDISPKNGVSQT